MADVEAFVWHDQDGNIKAVGHAVGDAKRDVVPLAVDGREVLKLTTPQEHLATLHLTHTVDRDRAGFGAGHPARHNPPSDGSRAVPRQHRLCDDV